jgi:hypothetical protein
LIIISIRSIISIFVLVKVAVKRIYFVWGGCSTYADCLPLHQTLILGIRIAISNPKKGVQEKDKIYHLLRGKDCIKSSL